MASIGGAIGKRWTAIAIAIAVTAAAIFVMRDQPVVLERLEAEIFDLHFRVRGVEQPNPNTVIVTADEKSAAELGRWPFSQRFFAIAIDRLRADGAKVIAFDIIFPQDELTFPAEVRAKLSEIVKSLPPDSTQAKDLRAVLDAPKPKQDPSID